MGTSPYWKFEHASIQERYILGGKDLSTWVVLTYKLCGTKNFGGMKSRTLTSASSMKTNSSRLDRMYCSHHADWITHIVAMSVDTSKSNFDYLPLLYSFISTLGKYFILDGKKKTFFDRISSF